MATPVVLLLATGLTHQQAALLSLDSPEHDSLLGTLGPTPGLSAEATRAVILSGMWNPEEQEASGDFPAHIARQVGAVVHGSDFKSIQAALGRGAALVWVETTKDDALWRSCITGLPDHNVLVVGHATDTEPAALIARGPDIYPQAEITAELTDIRPTLLSHFGIPPIPGPLPEGRALHEIFKAAHLSAEEHDEVLAHLRAVGYIA